MLILVLNWVLSIRYYMMEVIGVFLLVIIGTLGSKFCPATACTDFIFYNIIICRVFLFKNMRKDITNKYNMPKQRKYKARQAASSDVYNRRCRVTRRGPGLLPVAPSMSRPCPTPRSCTSLPHVPSSSVTVSINPGRSSTCLCSTRPVTTEQQRNMRNNLNQAHGVIRGRVYASQTTDRDPSSREPQNFGEFLNTYQDRLNHARTSHACLIRSSPCVNRERRQNKK
jgi:hypothetical protein